MESANPFEVAGLVISVVSLPLYLWVLVILVKCRNQEPFSGKFFQLFVSLGVADVSNICVLYPMFKFRQWLWIDWVPIFTNPTFGPIVLKATMFIIWFMTTSQYFGVLIIAANRYCNLKWIHNEVWTTNVHRFALTFQWLGAFLLGAPLLIEKCTLGWAQNSDGLYYPTPEYPKVFYMRFFAACGVVGLMAVLIVGLLYYLTYTNLRQQKPPMQSGSRANSQMRTNKAEIRLAVVGFVLFLTMAAIEVNRLVLAVARKMDIGGGLLQSIKSPLHQTVIVFSLSNPWILLVCCKKLRRKMIYF